jgi:hypothetical protein
MSWVLEKAELRGRWLVALREASPVGWEAVLGTVSVEASGGPLVEELVGMMVEVSVVA